MRRILELFDEDTDFNWFADHPIGEIALWKSIPCRVVHILNENFISHSSLHGMTSDAVRRP